MGAPRRSTPLCRFPPPLSNRLPMRTGGSRARAAPAPTPPVGDGAAPSTSHASQTAARCGLACENSAPLALPVAQGGVESAQVLPARVLEMNASYYYQQTHLSPLAPTDGAGVPSLPPTGLLPLPEEPAQELM